MTSYGCVIDITPVILGLMTKTTAISQTPSPTGGHTPAAADGQRVNPQSDFWAATLNMSWQLALVVLVPLLGGFALDNKFNTTPILTIVGFVLAMAGMAMVVWRQLQVLNPTNKSQKGPAA